MGVAAKIGEIAKERGISLKELSRQANIPYTTLYNAVKRDSKMDFETVRSIADAIGIVWYDLYPHNDTLDGASYEERLASACEWLFMVPSLQEQLSGECWSPKRANEWLTAHCDEVAALYNVQKADLQEFMPHRSDPTEEDMKRLGLHSISFHASDKQLVDCLCKIARKLSNLNEDGRKVALERVSELTEIPRYQLSVVTDGAPAGDSTQSAGTGDENDLE